MNCNSHTHTPRVKYVNVEWHAVSADEASSISVWDADTGRRIIQFVARMRVLPDGTELPVAVTAMRFDGSLRRLVAGFSDGCVRTFNLNNGALLRQVSFLVYMY